MTTKVWTNGGSRSPCCVLCYELNDERVDVYTMDDEEEEMKEGERDGRRRGMEIGVTVYQNRLLGAFLLICLASLCFLAKCVGGGPEEYFLSFFYRLSHDRGCHWTTLLATFYTRTAIHPPPTADSHPTTHGSPHTRLSPSSFHSHRRISFSPMLDACLLAFLLAFCCCVSTVSLLLLASSAYSDPRPPAASPARSAKRHG